MINIESGERERERERKLAACLQSVSLPLRARQRVRERASRPTVSQSRHEVQNVHVGMCDPHSPNVHIYTCAVEYGHVIRMRGMYLDMNGLQVCYIGTN